MIPIRLTVMFNTNTSWIPKQAITQTIQHQMRFIQWLNWPSIKQHIITTHPMIQRITPSFKSFPTVRLLIEIKPPWIMLMNQQQAQLIAYDGTLISHGLLNFELPKHPLIMVKTDQSLVVKHQLDPLRLTTLQNTIHHLNTIPFFKLKEIIIGHKKLKAVHKNGLIINIGTPKSMDESFKMLTYFLGQYRNQLSQYEWIDIQYPQRIIAR